jgi:uncharacterized repeat protein (TIGR01451 family)
MKSAARATFTVTNTNDSGAGSLRQAILDANAAPGLDLIAFNITAPSRTIAPASPLPEITDPVTIDGTTQPGFAGVPVVELNGANAGSGGIGLNITGGTSTVRGLAINRFGNIGVLLGVGGANVVEGNHIGVDTVGSVDLGNGSDGVVIRASAQNRIGGGTAAARNIISGNGSDGVQIDTAGATQNTVLGNFIGTDRNGAADLGNSMNGVFIFTSAINNTVGGVAASAANLISGNDGDGINMEGTSAAGNLAQGNLIGTNFAETGDLGNGSDGVQVVGSRNTVSNNRISFNAGDGIFMGSAGTGNLFTLNDISENDGLGIDLGPDGPTPNDLDDPDTGANALQNFPVLTTASSTGSTSAITGTLNSTPNTVFRIEFFANEECDPSGFGEGQDFIGATNATTNADGDVTFTGNLATGIPAGTTITATAIAPNGNTSEFSPCLAVGTTADLMITKTATPGSVVSGNNLTYTIVVTNNGPLVAENVIINEATPSGTTFVSVTSTQGTSTAPDPGTVGGVITTVGTLPAGGVVTVTLVVNVNGPAGQDITNTAFVTSATPDANLSNNTVTETTPVIAPPNIVSATKLMNPFRIRLRGTNFQPGIQVFIGDDTTPWPDVKYKDTTQITLRRGANLKARFPKGVPVVIRVVNPDGGEDTITFTR